MINFLKKIIKSNNFVYNLVSRFLNARYISLRKKHSDRYLIEKNWKKRTGRKLDLEKPITLNEKIQWLKLNDRKDIYTIWADKYACRTYIAEHFGSEYLVPLLFVTDDVSEINKENISSFPCVVKSNHSSGACHLYRKESDVNWKHLKRDCKTWLACDYYAYSQEWQYKNIKRYIVVEQMLLDKNGKIPNDYKLHFIEGELVFIYCSIDREDNNYRQIYDANWTLLPFSWDGGNKIKKDFPTISRPKMFDKMVEIGKHFAEKMHYVRVDFYEVDGKLYCGEITLHHGGGFDKFTPDEYDYKYGDLLKLPI